LNPLRVIFRPAGRKMTRKKRKYHAAAGKAAIEIA
jgi:hypothetical protein